MFHVSTVLGLEVRTLCLESDSFTLYDGDTIAEDFVNGDEIEEYAMKYRANQIDNMQL